MRSWVGWRRWAVLGLAVATIGFAPDPPAGQAQPSPKTTGEVRTVVLRPAADDALDWVDAGIGGAAAVGLALVIAGTAVVLRRRPQARVPLDVPTPRKE